MPFVTLPPFPPSTTTVDAERVSLEAALAAGDSLPATPKRDLLRAALTDLLQPLADTKAAITAGQIWDSAALADAVRANLPAGLAAGDFDQVDIDRLVPQILRYV